MRTEALSGGMPLGEGLLAGCGRDRAGMVMYASWDCAPLVPFDALLAAAKEMAVGAEADAEAAAADVGGTSPWRCVAMPAIGEAAAPVAAPASRVSSDMSVVGLVEAEKRLPLPVSAVCAPSEASSSDEELPLRRVEGEMERELSRTRDGEPDEELLPCAGKALGLPPERCVGAAALTAVLLDAGSPLASLLVVPRPPAVLLAPVAPAAVAAAMGVNVPCASVVPSLRPVSGLSLVVAVAVSRLLCAKPSAAPFAAAALLVCVVVVVADGVHSGSLGLGAGRKSLGMSSSCVGRPAS